MSAIRCIVAIVLAIASIGLFTPVANSRIPEQEAETRNLGTRLVGEMASSVQQISSIDIKLVDKQRGKTLPVRITFPTAGGAYPAVIFSHGAGGARDGYQFLADYWARHGYVVLQPSHEDSIAWNRERGTRFSFFQEMKRLPGDVDGWKNRVRDVEFLIDQLAELQASQPQLAGKIDEKRIGVSGHSYGAFTSQIIGGAQLPKQEHPDAKRDRRVAAIIAISPQGLRKAPNALGFDSGASFSAMNLPVLYMTGDRDGSTWNHPEQRQEAFRYVPAGDKYLVVIDGANHMTFTGDGNFSGKKGFGRFLWDSVVDSMMPAAYGDSTEHYRLVQECTTLFWNAYLKGEPEAKRFLQEDGLATLLVGKGQAQAR